MIRLLLVDDHPILREGLTALLTSELDIEIAGQFGTAEEAIASVPELNPDLAVLDVRLSGMSGIDACAILAARHPSLRVIILTSFASEGSMLSAFACGAKGFVVKESDPATLRHAIRAVFAGGTFVDPRLADRLVTLATRWGAKGPHGLTIQEMRVLGQLPRGFTNRQIAGQLSVSEDTVKTHLRNAMKKLQVHDRTEAAAIAIREKLA